MELPHNIPKAVLFFAELKDGGLHRNALELSSLSKKLAGELGGSTAAVVITGNDGHRLAEEIIAYGADKVYTIEDARFEKYQPEAYSIAIEQACKIADPNVLLLGHSLRGADLAPRLAWRLRVPLVTDCIDVLVDAYSKRVSAVRPVYGSKGLAVFTSSGRPHIATVRSKAFAPAEKHEGRTGEIVQMKAELAPDSIRIKYLEAIREDTEGPKLEDAEVVVSGGRGMGGEGNFAMLEELARILGGVVGCSRAAVDNKWMPSSRQVGLTGTIVSPRLYIAIGISGATQHMAGCASSQHIVAINTDADAPIFQRAHFGVVGDFKEVLPTIIGMCKSGQ